MIKSFSKKEIVFEKELNSLDNFVITFLHHLKNIKYVIVSGYVSIFFGRTRTTEDIDFLIEKISFEKFKKLAENLLSNNFWFINGDDIKELYALLKEGSSLRIAKKGEAIPNIEIKFPTLRADFYSLNNPIKVVCGKLVFYIGKIELQIAFKLYLGSTKDLEDARHLYNLFKDCIDGRLLEEFLIELGVQNKKWLLEGL